MGVYHCEKNRLTWGGIGGNSIVVDHLDDDVANNDPENLVPSCTNCNAARGRAGWLRSSLRPVDVTAIQALQACGRLTLDDIGKIFGVSAMTISRVVNGIWERSA
jgi:hypothetical protein